MSEYEERQELLEELETLIESGELTEDEALVYLRVETTTRMLH